MSAAPRAAAAAESSSWSPARSWPVGPRRSPPTQPINLSEDEIIVLAHCLDELVRRDDFEQVVEDKADRQVLNNLLSALEPLDVHVFSADYEVRLERARRALRGRR
jgi:hypothetical protein